VTEQHARGLCAECPGGLHVLEFARAQHLTADQPRIADPADDRQGEQHVTQAWPEHRHERNREKQTGKREQRVRHPADEIVQRAAEIAGHRAEHGADPGRHRDDHERDEERDARAGQDPGQNVAAELVEAEGMPPRGAGQTERQLLLRRVERRDRRPDDRGQRHHEHDGRPYLEHERRVAIAAELAEHAEKFFSAVSAVSAVKRPGT
jgi:hypothetical protein